MAARFAIYLTAVLFMTAGERADAGHFLREKQSCPLAGQLLDFTCNSGSDHRMFSEALQQKRDLYVYLPPGYDPKQAYPFILYLHGYMQDEQSFVNHLVRPLDRAIQCGQMPPVIVAAPDGTRCGQPSLFEVGSFFINSRAGRFEDWVMQDVWNFMMMNYSIRPEREAHAIAGVSMGGFGAYNLGMKYRDRFKLVLGVLPVLNLRWVDCHCDYMADFDPCCWGWRTNNDNPREVVGRYYHGLIKIRMRTVIYPIFGRGPESIAFASHQNPIEMLDRLNIQPGDLDMFISYAGKDEFNLDAQTESFLHVAHGRGLQPTVFYSPRGRHDEATAMEFVPALTQWLGEKLWPISQP